MRSAFRKQPHARPGIRGPDPHFAHSAGVHLERLGHHAQTGHDLAAEVIAVSIDRVDGDGGTYVNDAE